MYDITVIVPVYNKEKYIEQCINSILYQNNPNIKIIIIDDGSLDNSYDICCRLATNNKEKIEVIRQKQSGPIAARYTGIKNAKSKYITFVDADDFITPNAYVDAIEFMENDFDQIFYEISRYYSENEIKHEYHIINEGVYDRKRIESEIYPKLIWDFGRKTPGIECSQCVRIVKKDLLLDTYETLKGNLFYYGEDIVITYPLMKKIQKMAVISKSFYMHRQRSNNIAPEYISSNGYFEEISKMYMYLRKAMNSDGQYDFNKQIDYMYMYSVNLKKWSYNDYEYQRDFLFPFDKVRSGLKVILYGAGLVGRTYFMQLEKLSYCTELLWVDRDAEKMNDSKIKSLKELDKEYSKSFDFIVIALENKKIIKEVSTFLLGKGYSHEKLIY